MSQEVQLLNESFEEFLSSWLVSLKNENPDLPDYLIERHREMARYNCVGGKYFRGIQVLTFARIGAEETGIAYETIEKKALALAWAIEVLQSCFLVADDLMDGSITRRGRPCWYLVEGVGNDAINDALVLESFMHYLINVGTDDKTYRPILKLYLDTATRTQMGQTLDLLCMPQGKKGPDVLRTFSLDVYKRIVKFKTAYYTFATPMRAGLMIGGVSDEEIHSVVEKVALEIGEKFQIQDDYLDAFQDPKILGKIGRDIEDHKCSWVCVKTLELANDEQRKRFEDNYGYDDEEKVKTIKQIYNEVGIPEVYKKQEEDSLQRVLDIIASSSKVKKTWFDPIIAIVHNRQK